MKQTVIFVYKKEMKETKTKERTKEIQMGDILRVFDLEFSS